MLEQLLTKKQKKALEKHFNDPKTIARRRRIDLALAKMEAKRQVLDEMDRVQERKRLRLLKGVIWTVIIVAILALLVG
tara:strand:- start:381 stop:614 length:234 start_codon:yes stop_codon:yes gene_type:complete